MNAARRGRTEIVKMLLGAGADIEQRDWRGQTAEDIATLFDKHEAKRLLSEQRWADLIRAADQGRTREVKRLIRDGADIQGPAGGTALLAAARGGHAAVVNLLLEHGVDYTHTDRNGHTAEDLAGFAGHVATQEILAEHRMAQDQEQER
jgi:ankyrin repeat protein